MFCEKCGAENRENAKFCEKCGAPMPETQQARAVSPNQSALQLHKKQIIAGGIVLLAALACVIGFLVYSNSQKQAEYAGKPQATDKYSQEQEGRAEQYQAYYDLCMEYQEKYGVAGYSQWDVRDIFDLKGLCAAKLIDFDGDGSEELLLGYEDRNSGVPLYAYEIWAWQDGKLNRILDPIGCMHSNGDSCWIKSVVKDGKIYLLGHALKDFDEQYLCMRDGKFVPEYTIDYEEGNPTAVMNGKTVDVEDWNHIVEDFGWYTGNEDQYLDDQKGNMSIPLASIPKSEMSKVLEMTQNTITTLKAKSTKQSTEGAAQRQAYYDLCLQYQKKYGIPGLKTLGNEDEDGIWESWDTFGLSGLCVVELVDFDQDGSQELVLGYESPSSEIVNTHQYEVWAWKNDELVNILKPTECSHDQDAQQWIETIIYEGKVYLVKDDASQTFDYLSYNGETFKTEIEIVDDFYINKRTINGAAVSQKELDEFDRKLGRQVRVEEGWEGGSLYFNENPKIVLPLRFLTEETANQVLEETAKTLQSLAN